MPGLKGCDCGTSNNLSSGYSTLDILKDFFWCSHFILYSNCAFNIGEDCVLCDDRQGSTFLSFQTLVREVFCSIETWKASNVDVWASIDWFSHYFYSKSTPWIWWWTNNFTCWWKWIWWTHSILSSLLRDIDAGLTSIQNKSISKDKNRFSLLTSGLNIRALAVHRHWRWKQKLKVRKHFMWMLL